MSGPCFGIYKGYGMCPSFKQAIGIFYTGVGKNSHEFLYNFRVCHKPHKIISHSAKHGRQGRQGLQPLQPQAQFLLLLVQNFNCVQHYRGPPALPEANPEPLCLWHLPYSCRENPLHKVVYPYYLHLLYSPRVSASTVVSKGQRTFSNPAISYPARRERSHLFSIVIWPGGQYAPVSSISSTVPVSELPNTQEWYLKPLLSVPFQISLSG